jgi:phage-related protein
MASIKDIPPHWDTSGGVTYTKNTVVIRDEFYYFATQDNTSTIDWSNDGPLYWDGVDLDDQGITKPKFFWSLTYGSPGSITPLVNVTKLGDGYEQRTTIGINNTLLTFNLGIDGMDLPLTLAVGTFLYRRFASESFLWTPPPPFSTRGKYVCRQFDLTPVFYNNFSLKAKFEEVLV